MEIIDVTGIEQNIYVYGGASCRKVGITLNGENYLLKLPGSLKGRELKNIILSYSNGPVCEFLGSKIFSMLGMPVHEVKLGRRGDKIVALCKDFTSISCRLSEFREIKATYEPAFFNEKGEETDGTGGSIDEALVVLRNHPIFQYVPNAESMFWDMFIVDALIGNPDRNNGNWGVLVGDNKVLGMAPVYDNGNCFNDKWDDNKIMKFMSDEKLFLNEAFKGKVCYFINSKGRKINPFIYLEKDVCDLGVERLLHMSKKIDECKTEIYSFIDQITIISSERQEFYKKLVEFRSRELNRIASIRS